MFDVDNLDTFVNSSQDRGGTTATAETESSKDAGAPKSREERLREFYANRQQVAPAFEPPSRELSKREEPTPEAAGEALKCRQRGNDLYEAKDYEAAVEHYSTAIKLAPSAVLHSNRAAAYMMLGWWDQALRDTRRALKKDPDNARALERHGKVLLAQDSLEDALRVATDMEARIPEEERRQMKQLPANIRRLRWLIDAAKEPANLDDCRMVLKEFGSSRAELVSPLGVRLRKRLTKLLVDRSDALDNQRKIRPAVAKNKWTEQDGDEIQEITPYAEEAIQITGELLQDYPDDAELRYWRGRALVRLGRHTEAEAQLQKGLKEDPEHGKTQQLVETMNVLEDMKARGNAFYKEGRLNEAIQQYTLGIDEDPDCHDTLTVATLYYNRAAAYRKKGEFEKALEDTNLSLALRPKWTKALYRRGILLLELGRPAEALTELKVVQRADPTFDDDLETWLRRAHNWLSKAKGETNYYQFMRLPMDATGDEVRQQYRRLCLLWHPDKNGGTEEGRQRFEDLQQAYKFLMDEERRKKYDFGIWTEDKVVRHHVKKREKKKDAYDYDQDNEEDYVAKSMPTGLHEKALVEDDKIECAYWGDGGVPHWLQEKRKLYNKNKYGAA